MGEQETKELDILQNQDAIFDTHEPENVEFEYVDDMSENSNLSEMDVLNHSHYVIPDEDNLASVSEIDKALNPSFYQNNQKEVPFPSFLQEPIYDTSLPENSDEEKNSAPVSLASPQEAADISENIHFQNENSDDEDYFEEKKTTVEAVSVADDMPIQPKESLPITEINQSEEMDLSLDELLGNDDLGLDLSDDVEGVEKTETVPEVSFAENMEEIQNSDTKDLSTDISDIKIDDDEKYDSSLNNSEAMILDSEILEEDNPIMKLLQIEKLEQNDFPIDGFFKVSKKKKIQEFKATQQQTDILLSDLKLEEMASWNLIVFQQNVVQLNDKVTEILPFEQPYQHRYVSLFQNGEIKMKLFNEADLKVVNVHNSCADFCEHTIVGDFYENSALITNDILTLSLAKHHNCKISFASPVSGILTGPQGALIYFFGLQNLWISNV